jgi:hypothetical protein
MPPLAAIGSGSGLTMPVTAAILTVLPHDQAGVAAGILNAAREASGLLGVTVIGAILTARQATALAGGATPHAAFLHGYSAGLAAAAALVAVGGAIALRTLRDRGNAATAQMQPGTARRRAPQPAAAALTDVPGPVAARPAVTSERLVSPHPRVERSPAPV